MGADRRASKPSTRGFKEVVAVRHPERLKYLLNFFSFPHILSSCYHGRNNLFAVITRARKEDSGVIDLSEKIKNKKRSLTATDMGGLPSLEGVKTTPCMVTLLLLCLGFERESRFKLSLLDSLRICPCFLPFFFFPCRPFPSASPLSPFVSVSPSLFSLFLCLSLSLSVYFCV